MVTLRIEEIAVALKHRKKILDLLTQDLPYTKARLSFPDFCSVIFGKERR